MLPARRPHVLQDHRHGAADPGLAVLRCAAAGCHRCCNSRVLQAVSPVACGVLHTVQCNVVRHDSCGAAGLQCALVPLREQQVGHVHGPGCGHEAVPHDGHIDYLVSWHRTLWHAALRQISAAVVWPGRQGCSTWCCSPIDPPNQRHVPNLASSGGRRAAPCARRAVLPDRLPG
jgi:hypothetical protein